MCKEQTLHSPCCSRYPENDTVRTVAVVVANRNGKVSCIYVFIQIADCKYAY